MKRSYKQCKEQEENERLNDKNETKRNTHDTQHESKKDKNIVDHIDGILDEDENNELNVR